MIHISGNECPICLTEDLNWNINICKSDMHMFKCGHGTCKSCYIKLINTTKEFACPCCRTNEQYYYNSICSIETNKWTTFSEWYSEYEIYIKTGTANNVVKNSSFGKQLLRLIKENRKNKKIN